MAASERAQEIARAIVAYEEAVAAVDPKKRERLAELMVMMQPLSEALSESRRHSPLLSALKEVQLDRMDELRDCIEQVTAELDRVSDCERVLERLGYHRVERPPPPTPKDEPTSAISGIIQRQMYGACDAVEFVTSNLPSTPHLLRWFCLGLIC